MRFAVFARPELGPGRLGRVVQRLTELETYRAMSMLGLPRARTLTATLNALDARLTALVDGLGDDDRPAETVLHDLLKVSAQLETEVTRKVEDSLATIPNVKRITSSVVEGTSTTAVEFHLNTDLMEALNDSKDSCT